jgi:hypothetical protein
MRKLINSAFLLLLTLFIVGKSWADCPDFNISQATSDYFLSSDKSTINTNYLIFTGIVQAQNLQYLSTVNLKLQCDGAMHDNSIMYYSCGPYASSEPKIFLKRAPSLVNKYNSFHTLNLIQKYGNATFVYGQAYLERGGSVSAELNCATHFIDAQTKQLINVETFYTINKQNN